MSDTFDIKAIRTRLESLAGYRTDEARRQAFGIARVALDEIERLEQVLPRPSGAVLEVAEQLKRWQPTGPHHEIAEGARHSRLTAAGEFAYLLHQLQSAADTPRDVGQCGSVWVRPAFKENTGRPLVRFDEPTDDEKRRAKDIGCEWMTVPIQGEQHDGSTLCGRGIGGSSAVATVPRNESAGIVTGAPAATPKAQGEAWVVSQYQKGVPRVYAYEPGSTGPHEQCNRVPIHGAPPSPDCDDNPGYTSQLHDAIERAKRAEADLAVALDMVANREQIAMDVAKKLDAARDERDTLRLKLDRLRDARKVVECTQQENDELRAELATVRGQLAAECDMSDHWRKGHKNCSAHRDEIRVDLERVRRERGVAKQHWSNYRQAYRAALEALGVDGGSTTLPRRITAVRTERDALQKRVDELEFAAGEVMDGMYNGSRFCSICGSDSEHHYGAECRRLADLLDAPPPPRDTDGDGKAAPSRPVVPS